MLKKMRQIAGRNLVNIPGWHTNRKIIVFESDDWGAVRMSSKENLVALSGSGIKVQNCHYLQNDALASETDLNQLFELLHSHKGSQGKSPVITANVIMTNPDFEKIKATDFTEYHYELFTDTLDKYPEHQNSFKCWKDGINKELFHPQFHGREHVQVLRWMDFLRDTNSETRRAFDANVFGLSTTATSENRKSYLASYDWTDSRSREFILSSVSEGLSLFKSVFGFESLSAIAPNYVWHREVEKTLHDYGVRFIQGTTVQKSPVMGNNGFEKIRHFTGQKNDLGQRYLVRNVEFEPSSNPDLDWIDRCMQSIKTAFRWNKPAVIATHRVNFIGFINPENRDRNLKTFDQLLKNIIKKWPEVEFMTSDQLGQIIENDA